MKKVEQSEPSARQHGQQETKTWISRLTEKKYIKPALFAFAFAVIGIATLLFTFAATPPVTGNIKWNSGGYCLDNSHGLARKDNRVQLWACHAGSEQIWTISGNSIRFGAADSKYCLAIRTSGGALKTQAHLWTCDGLGPQVWNVKSDGTIFNPSSGLCLDNRFRITENGNKVWLYRCNGTVAQQWKVPTSTTPPVVTPPPPVVTPPPPVVTPPPPVVTPPPPTTNPPTPTPSAANPCSATSQPPQQYKHIIWILEENRSLSDVINNSQAPYMTKLAQQCGYSTNFVNNEPIKELGPGYHSVVNYVADLAGSNCTTGNGKTGQGCLLNSATYGPLKYHLSTTTLLDQINGAHLTWKSYQESAPHNCTLSDSQVGRYAPWHDGVLYFTSLRSQCPTNDVAIPTLNGGSGTPQGALIDDIKNNTLPTFSYITPNLDNDTHSQGPPNADRWLQTYLKPLFDSKTYKEGGVAVFILWDEAHANNDPLPNLTIAPTVNTGAVRDTMSGFAVLRATEDLLGLPHLGCATGTPPGGTGQCFAGATTDLRKTYGL